MHVPCLTAESRFAPNLPKWRMVKYHPSTHYAMQITQAWSAFFGAMVLISTLLFFFTPLPVWSVFSNFLYLPLVLLMLTVELLVRRKRLPEMYGNRFWESFKISWNSVRNKRADNETRRSDA
ncbi:MAG: hypothetical protein IPN04_06960 [Rhodoferax sp.]|nr:hypothetical protein [Rhodoferax sp.]